MMHYYEMYPASIVEDTEWTGLGLQTDGQKEGWMDSQSETIVPP